MTNTMSYVTDARPVRWVLLSKSYWMCRGDFPIDPGLDVPTGALFLVLNYEPASSPWKLKGKRNNKQQLGSEKLLY
jgi:hypothetical protein